LNDIKLPVSPTDKAGIANMIFTSKKANVGNPRASFVNQAKLEIDDNQVVWNADRNIWEISFDDAGSKEYYLKTKFTFKQNTTPRPDRPVLTKKGGREGIDDFVVNEPIDFVISPNPASKNISLQINNPNLLGTKAYLKNELGMGMQSFVITKSIEQIDIEKLPHGLYFIHFEAGRVGKFMKE
jgi:hypothetical protein